jgi:hypothetical protein
MSYKTKTFPWKKDTINHQTKKANISVSCQPSLFKLSDISKKKVEIKFTNVSSLFSELRNIELKHSEPDSPSY